MPDVPGIGETGEWLQLHQLVGVPRARGRAGRRVKRVNEELTAIAALPEVRERLRDLGLAAQSSTPQQFADLIRSETEKVGGS